SRRPARRAPPFRAYARRRKSHPAQEPRWNTPRAIPRPAGPGKPHEDAALLPTHLPGAGHGLKESLGQTLRQVAVVGLSQVALDGEDDLLVRVDDQERRPADRAPPV